MSTLRGILLIILLATSALIAAALLRGNGRETRLETRGSPIYGEKLAASLAQFEQSDTVVESLPPLPPAAAAFPRVAAEPTSPVRNGATGNRALEQGRTAFREGDWERALALFDAAIADGGDYAAHSHRGDVLVRLGRYDEAIQSYRRSFAMNPSFTFALHGVAIAHLAKGERESALETYRQILRIRPDDRTAQSQISKLAGQPSSEKPKP